MKINNLLGLFIKLESVRKNLEFKFNNFKFSYITLVRWEENNQSKEVLKKRLKDQALLKMKSNNWEKLLIFSILKPLEK